MPFPHLKPKPLFLAHVSIVLCPCMKLHKKHTSYQYPSFQEFDSLGLKKEVWR